MRFSNVYDTLIHAATAWPQQPAVYDEWGALSFSELYSEAEALRQQLLALGIGPGMGIAVKAQNSRNFIIGLYAASGTGAAVMPMAHQLKKAEIDDILKEADLHALLDDGSGSYAFETGGTDIEMKQGHFRFFFTGIPLDKPFAPHVQNPAFMRFTSGTTGKSKGVLVSHQSVIERIEAANTLLELGPGDCVVWVLPMAYHFIVSIVLYVRFGAAIAIARDFMARPIIDISNRYGGTLLYASPVQIRLLANDTSGAQLPTLKKIISTSAGISLDVCLAFKKRFGLDVSQAYGIIEIGLPMINFVKSAEHPEAVGYALPDYTVDILDEQYQPLPDGTVGLLGIKGPGMFAAYLLPPTPREEVLKNGYFITADFAVKMADGLVKIEGRSKSVINISGVKVFPEEIEAILENLPGIKQARISSKPHPLMGQVIEGEIVVEEGQTVDVEEVIRYCRKRLSSFKAPQRLVIVDRLPMTGSGKVQRHNG